MSLSILPDEITCFIISFLQIEEINAFLKTSKKNKKTFGKAAHQIAWSVILMQEPGLKPIFSLRTELGLKNIVLSLSLFILVFKENVQFSTMDFTVSLFLQKLGVLNQMGHQFDHNGELHVENKVLIRSLRRDSICYQFYEGDPFLRSLNILGRCGLMCVLESTYKKDFTRWSYFDYSSPIIYDTESIIYLNKKNSWPEVNFSYF